MSSKILVKTLLVTLGILPLTALAGGPRGNGMGGMHMPGAMNSAFGHGALVSHAAFTARSDDMPVGTSVRSVARDKARGPVRANVKAVNRVDTNKGMAHANSVLSGGTGRTTTSHGRHVAHAYGKTRTHSHRHR